MPNKISRLRYKDTKFTLAVKIIMTAVYAWSCFFWAGVTILNFYINTPEYSYLATGFLTGSIFITIGLILTFLRFHIAQFPFIVAGTVVFLKNAGEMIDVAIKSEVVFKPSFELRYLPVIAVAGFSFVLAVMSIARAVSERKTVQEEYNNRPTQSILEKRNDNKR